MKENMIYIRFFLFSFIVIFFAGCNDSEPRVKSDTKVKKEIKQKTMTSETELTASASEIVKISTPTVVCGTCEINIKSALENQEGIIDSKIDVKKKSATVTFDPAVTNVQKIRQVISDAGYDADDVKRNLNAYQKLDECCKIESNIHS